MKIMSVTLLGFIFLSTPLFSTALPEIIPDLLDAQFIIGGSHTLQAGQAVEGSLVVLFAQLSVEPGARPEDGLITFSSNVNIRGAVDGDILSLESDVDVDEYASLAGRCRKLDLIHVVLQLPQIYSAAGVEP